MIKKFEEFINEDLKTTKRDYMIARSNMRREEMKSKLVTKISEEEFKKDIINEILSDEKEAQPTIITNLNALGENIFDELKNVFATRCAFVTDFEDFKKFEQDLKFRENEYFVIGIKDLRSRESHEVFKKAIQIFMEYSDDDSAKRTNSSVMLMFGDDFKYVYDEISNVIKDRLSRKRILEIE